MQSNWSWSCTARMLVFPLLASCAPVALGAPGDSGEADWAQAQAHRQHALAGGAEAPVHEQQHLAALRRATLAGHAGAAAELGAFLVARSRAAGADDPRAARIRADGEALLQLAAEAGDRSAADQLGSPAPQGTDRVVDGSGARPVSPGAGDASPAVTLPPDHREPGVVADAHVPATGDDTQDASDSRDTGPPSPASMAHDRGLDALRAADFRMARRHFARAAEAGHAAAHNNLGLMWWRGLGGPVDVARALGHLQRASALGHLPATENLALAYQFGVGVPADAMRAIGLWQVAEHRGSTQAAAALAALGLPARDEAMLPVARAR